ncbi:MAG: PEP-utilizing enzyme [Syntrophobacteraceae bacterium]|jgi:pyruvate,water dikinase|nr:PEP-utilizing enzyme [Syntrophobacteraceae bacterium]
MLKFLDMFRRSRVFESDSPEKTAFQNKYRHFQNLLAGNNRALEIMTDLEQVCYGPKPFSLEYITRQSEKLVSRVYDIAEDLNALSGGRYEGLFDAVERIGVEILQELVRKRRVDKTFLTIPLQHLSLERASEVGGKAASLGEITNRVHLPVPRGFAVSAYACHHFLEFNRLYDKAEEILKGLDIDDTEKLLNSSRDIHSLILYAPLPPDLEASLMEQMDQIVKERGPEVQMAMRSSATSEDSEASFAGQHSSFLGVTRERVVEAYKRVVASTFNPRAIYYRRSKGYPDDHVIMSALCIEMVDSRAAGVMYTRDPNDNRRDVVMVNAVWGLGVGAVSGSAAADYYEVEKEGRTPTVLSTAHKPTRIALDERKALVEVPVPEDMRDQACLSRENLAQLVEYGLALEEHYRVPLDIEWAMNMRGRLVLLQARPLSLDFLSVRKDEGEPAKDRDALQADFPGHPILLKSGMTASRGKASGLAYVLTSDHNLLNIPEGSILIAPQTSPRYVAILGRVQAIVTDVGSVTGHMASVAREFSIPTLVGTGNATRVIPHGEEITLDATNGVVFQGRVESILERKKPVNPMKGSPAYKKAHSVLKRIAVLNLVDPKSENFAPEGCETMHDVIRFAHEMSMREMFSISDDIEVSERFAVRVKVPLPMKIFAVDLGGGLRIPPDAREARAEDVLSVPFQALLRGMTHPGVQWLGAVGVDWKGFASILTESIFSDPTMDDRMGGPNYVVVSSEYLNFNSRLGYHFAVVDAYCGPQVNDNYITFSFKGGAADIGRRSRRATLIAQILKRLELKTEIKGDMVRGEIKKYDSPLMEAKLDMIGRLLGAVRLLDMVLSDAGRIEWYVEEFFKGNYTFQRVA